MKINEKSIRNDYVHAVPERPPAMSINLNNAPLWITAKALEKLKQFRAGRLFPKRTYGKKYLTFRVNKRWRLL
ncbi:ParE family toxin-like protein [Serratia marcescens]|uniref:ParE family toxin-like protein n=1 Tax=Serratia marcescens TaxID=615 RepID=UPI003FA7E5C2